ncbi:unnamed protein product [Camellia sinensis]
MSFPMDSPLCDIDQLQVSFPPSLQESDDDAEKDDAKEKAANDDEAAVGAKSSTLNKQVLDLTQDEENEVSKSASPKRAISEAEVQTTEKSLDQTLLQIDAEIEVERIAEKLSQLSAEVDTQPIAEAEQST